MTYLVEGNDVALGNDVLDPSCFIRICTAKCNINTCRQQCGSLCPSFCGGQSCTGIKHEPFRK